MIRAAATGYFFVLCSGMLHAQPEIEFAAGYGWLDPGFGLEDGYTYLMDTDDYNGDGFVDLLYAYGTNDDVWLSLGFEGGGFQVLGPFEGVADLAMAVGDIDGDGALEIITRGVDSSTILFVRTADGGLEEEEMPGLIYRQPALNVPVPFTVYARAADIDGDGKSEIAFNTTEGAVFVRWSSRDPADPYEAVTVPGLGEDNVLYEVLDYDGDGDLDLLLFDEASQKFTLLAGTGSDDGWTPAIVEPAFPRIAIGERPVFGQLDDDPAIDMVHISAGTGMPQIVTNFATAASTPIDVVVPGVISPLAIVQGLEVPGIPTLILERASGNVLIRDPLAKNPVEHEVVLGGFARQVYVGGFFHDVPIDPLHPIDADRDGDLDLLALGFNYAEKGRVIENRSGSIDLPLLGSTASEIPAGILHVLPGDLSGDGIDELIISGNTATRILDISTDSEQRLVGARARWNTCLTDLDGDGRDELVQGNEVTGELLIYPIDADGNAGSRITYTNPDGNSFYSVLAADFDGDGRADIAALDRETFKVHILRGIPGPGVEPMGMITDSGQGSFQLPAAIDFDGDGALDLAIGRIEADIIEFYRNDGDGAFSFSHSIAADNPYWLTAADIDLDGITDLAVSNYHDAVTLLYLDDGGQVRDSTTLRHFGSATEIVVQDLNGDELPDVASSNNQQGVTSQRSIIWLQQTGGGFVRVSDLPTIDATSIAVSDLNADGAADIVTVSNDRRRLQIHWSTPSPCPTDLNGDGAVNFFDISAFLQARPDWNGDDVHNFFDVSDYLQEFLAGCP